MNKMTDEKGDSKEKSFEEKENEAEEIVKEYLDNSKKISILL